MAKDKELVISADEVNIRNENRKSRVSLIGIDMEDIIADMDEVLFDEILKWTRNNRNPDDVFDEKDLDKWATENGYIKE